METAIRWSPSSTLLDQRFLLIDVNGHSFRRCNVERYDGKNLQHETVSTYTKVPPFRAFDWASHDESLVAVGQWSGEVTVLRIDDAASNVSLPAKHQRLCNTVAFSRTGLLAAGLERVRNDFCLNIWDVNQRLPALSSPKPSPAKRFVEPYRSYASSEAISSIKFFSAQPEVLISGVKGRGIRIYDLRENTGNPSLQFQTSSVHNIAIDPLDENYFACAGVPKDTTIQIWDRRHGSPFSTLSFGSTADLSVPLGGPVLEYKEAFPTTKISPQPPLGDPTGVMVSSIWSLRYCKGKSGCLGALANNGDFKVFETKHEYSLLGSSQGAEPHGIDIHPDERDAEYDVPMADDRPILTKRVHQVENACDDDRKGRLKSERVVAFDFTNLAGSKGTPCVIVLRGDRSVGILELNGPAPALAVSPFSEIVVSKANKSNSNFHNFPRDEHFVTSTIQRIRPSEKARISNTTETELQSRLSGVPVRGEFATGTGKKPQSSREAHEQLIESHMSNGKLDIGEALACFNVAFRRCAEGYLLDCDKNIDLLPDDPWLQNMWRWIRREFNDQEIELS